MRDLNSLADQLFLTDLVETATYKEITKYLESKYHQVEEEWPSEYYDELNQLLNQIFNICVNKTSPKN